MPPSLTRKDLQNLSELTLSLFRGVEAHYSGSCLLSRDFGDANLGKFCISDKEEKDMQKFQEFLQIAYQQQREMMYRS